MDAGRPEVGSGPPVGDAFGHVCGIPPDAADELRGERELERHVWGLGRHHAGSNFFWYLKDPAGNFSEYYSDMDCTPEGELWNPEVFDGPQGLFNWGPPPPPSFLAPDDLASLMTGQHAPSR